MILVSYRPRGSDGPWHAGIVHEQALVDASAYPLSRADTAVGQAGLSVRTFFEGGRPYRGEVFAGARAKLGAKSYLIPLDMLELGPPVPDPDKILCLGVNYREHAAEAQQELPAVPLFFAKFRNSLIGPSSPILLHRVSTQIDYEGELAVIIGTRCKAVDEQEALKNLAGYSIMNERTAHDYHLQT